MPFSANNLAKVINKRKGEDAAQPKKPAVTSNANVNKPELSGGGFSSKDLSSAIQSRRKQIETPTYHRVRTEEASAVNPKELLPLQQAAQERAAAERANTPTYTSKRISEMNPTHNRPSMEAWQDQIEKAELIGYIEPGAHPTVDQSSPYLSRRISDMAMDTSADPRTVVSRPLAAFASGVPAWVGENAETLRFGNEWALENSQDRHSISQYALEQYYAGNLEGAAKEAVENYLAKRQKAKDSVQELSDFADRMQDYAQQGLADASYGIDTDKLGGKVAVQGLQALQSVSQNLLDVAVGQALGVGEAAKAVDGASKIANKARTLFHYIPFAERSFGASAGEARRADADLSTQLDYAVKNTVKEVATEMMWSIGDVYGIGAADDWAESRVKDLVRKSAASGPMREVLSTAASLGMAFSTEAMEEVVGTLVEEFYLNQILDPNAEPPTGWDLVNKLVESGMVGGLSGMIMGGGNVLTQNANARINQTIARASEIIEAAENSGSEEAKELAAKVKENADKGYIASDLQDLEQMTAQAEYEKYTEEQKKADEEQARNPYRDAPTEAAGELIRRGKIYESPRAAQMNPETASAAGLQDIARQIYEAENETGKSDTVRKAVEEAKKGAVSDAAAEEILKSPQATEYFGVDVTDNMTEAEKLNAVKAAVEVAAEAENRAAAARNEAQKTTTQSEENTPSTGQFLDEIKGTLGESGQGAFSRVVGDGAGPMTRQAVADRAMAATLIYNAGRNGTAVESIQLKNNPLTADEMSAMYSAGVKDGRQSSNRTGERQNDLAAGERSEEISQRARETRARRKGAAVQRAAVRAAVENEAAVSPKEIGFRNGSDTKNLKVLPESAYSALNKHDRNAVEQLKKKGFKVVLMVSADGNGIGGLLEDVQGKHYRGAIQDGNTIFLSADHWNYSIEQIARHEYFHSVLDSNPELRENIVQKLYDTFSAAEILKMQQAYAEDYNWSGVDENYVLDEILCDAFGGMDVFEDKHLFPYHVTDYSEIVREMAKGAKVGEGLAEGTTRYSLEAFEDGTRFVNVQADQSLFDGLSLKEKAKLAEKIINEKFKGRVIGIDNRTYVDRASSREYAHSSKRSPYDSYQAKLRASTELDNLIDAGTNYRHEADGRDGHFHKDNVGGFDYYDTIFKVANDYYSGVVNVELVAKGKRLKDVTKIENITEDIYRSYGENPKTIFLRDTSMDNIAQPSADSNTKSTKQNFSEEKGSTVLELADAKSKAYRTTQEDNERARKNAIEEYRKLFTPEYAEKYAKKAERKYGTTSNYDKAAYLDVNGKLIDFSDGQRYRVNDHREIAEILDFLPDTREYSDGLIEFMNLGNIRMQTYGIDIAKAPNAKQIAALKQFVRHLDGEITVDISDERGYTIDSIDYGEGTRPDRVVNDILRYFNEGIKPSEGSSMYARFSEESRNRYLEADKSIESENIEKGNAAIDELLQRAAATPNPSELFVKDAMYRSGIGSIDIVYGTPGKGKKLKGGYGLSHIIAKRDAENGNGILTARKIVEVIAKATEAEIQSNNQTSPGNERLKLHYDDYTAVLVKSEIGNHWLLTGWDDYKKTSEGYAAGEVSDSSGATADAPTLTRRNGGNTSDFDLRITQDETSVNKEHLSEEPTTSSFALRSAQAQDDIEQLQQDLLLSREEASYWRSLRTESSRVVNATDVKRVSKEVLAKWESDLKPGAITERMTELADCLYKGMGMDEVIPLALEIADEICSRAKVTTDSAAYNEYLRLKQFVRSHAIKRSTDVDDPYFYKRNFGKIKFTSNGTPMDVMWGELQSEFGKDLFPDEVNTVADKMLHLADVLESIEPVYENPYNANYAEAVEECAYGLMTDIMRGGVRYEPVMITSENGAAASEYNKTIAEKNRQIERLQKENEKTVEYYKEREARAKELLKQVRERRDERIAELKQHYKEVAMGKKWRRAESDARKRLQRIAKRLQNRKLPAVSRALLEQYIGDLDTAALSITGAKLEELKDLQVWYSNKKATDPDFIANPEIEKKLARINKKRISELSIDEVVELTQILLNIENTINTERKMIDTEDRRDVYAMGLETIDNIEASRGTKADIKDWVISNTLSPVRAVRRFTGYAASDPMYRAVTALADGQRKMFDYQMRASRMFDAWAKDKKYTKSLQDVIKIQGFRGGELVDAEITRDMAIALYMHAKNDQNLAHIRDGGVTIPDLKALKKDPGNAYGQGAIRIKLSPAMVKQIESKLTAKDKAYAAAAAKYFDTMAQMEINEVSEKLVGYSLAQVENYFPINTDSSFTRKEFESLQMDGTIEGMGFLKERTDAKNPIYLRGFTDVLNKSIDMNAKYVGLAIPVRNFNKLWNVTTADYSDADNIEHFTGSVKEAMNQKWGKRGVNYIEKMMTDLQNANVKSDELDSLLGKVRSNYAGAVLTLNLSVAIKQAASYPTAGAVLGGKALLKALANPKVDANTIAKYTPLYWYRSQGFADQELGDLKKRNKQIPKVLNWIQAADMATTRTLWKASEYYVRDNNKDLQIGSEEYYQEVARIYNRVIEETQPNYTTMQRPQLLRSDSSMVQSIAMFKTQPFQNFNVLYDAVGEYEALARAKKAGADVDLKSAQKNVTRAVSSQVVQLAVFSAMTFIWNMIRRKHDKYEDEEGEMNAGSVFKGIGKDMISGSFSVVPFGSNVYELMDSIVNDATYYGFDSVTITALDDTAQAIISEWGLIKEATGTIAEGKTPDWNTLRIKTKKNLNKISKLAGIPLENVNNLYEAAYHWAALYAEGEYMGEYRYLTLTISPESSKVKYYALLKKAWLNDKTAFNQLQQEMLDSGYFTEKGINQKIGSWKKETGME